MANLKEVRNRIVSVQSTQQITKAMKMVSAAKLRKAQQAITQIRPYTASLKEIMDRIKESMDGDAELKLAENRAPERVLIVVMTSDKGLCGSFNLNLIKTASRLAREKYAEQAHKGHLTILPVGRKAFEFFKKTRYHLHEGHLNLQGALDFSTAATMVESFVKGFMDGTYDRVDVVYSEFRNAATQEFKAEQLLPLTQIVSDKPVASQPAKVESHGYRDVFIFEPSQEEIIRTLVPSFLKIQFYRSLLDTSASEHGARMTSMDKATENAGELIKALRLEYNRARQAAITKEISEIVGGAAALED